MVNTVRLYTSIDGYNPPNFYVQYTLQKIAILETQMIARYDDIPCSIDNHIGTIDIPITQGDTKLYNISVVTYKDTDLGYYFMGTVRTITRLNTGTLRVTFDVDWFTSQVLTAFAMGLDVPMANKILYHRLTTGEFSYLDEGITPLNISYQKYGVLSSEHNYNMFEFTTPIHILVYRDSINNVNLICGFLTALYGFATTPENAYRAMQYRRGYTDSDLDPSSGTYKFNSANVIFWGMLPINWTFLIEHNMLYSIQQNGKYRDVSTGNLVQESEGNIFTLSFSSLNEGSGNRRYWIFDETTRHQCTLSLKSFTFRTKDYEQFKLIGANGELLCDFPKGIDVYSILNGSTMVLLPDSANPSFIIYPSAIYNGITSISIPFYAVDYFQDSESYYYATKRDYIKESQNLQSLNNLVSGITGAGTEGAMIGGFSRSSGLIKAGIGTAVGLAGAFANYGYSELYANNEALSIEDRNAKVQVDTMALGLSADPDLDMLGFYGCYYDAETRSNISVYQANFGYKTNSISTNVELNTLSGYVKADVLMKGGLRKEVENYIVSMLANGVMFS